MNKAEIEIERAEYAMKFFDYTETPIKEWIANYIKKDVSTIFPDYVDESEIIGFMINNKHYKAYVVAMPFDTNSLVDKELLEHEKVRKACSILFDAVREVFMSVTGAIKTPELEYIKSFMPIFVEDKMAFYLKRVNRKAMQLQAADLQRKQIEKFLQTADKTGVTEEQKNMIQESLNAINTVFTKNTKEMLDKEEQECKTTNEELTTYDWLHIVVEETSPDDEELKQESMKRLPTFGLQFQDPEEENYIDKLKKEYNVKE
jgi:hypothetical protein